MVHHTPIMTLVGGLILVLVSASCSSKANTRTTASPPARDNVVASDRPAYQEDRITSSNDRITPADRMTSADRMASTEGSVPTNRTELGDNRLASDRMVPCADQKGDTTASIDCGSPNRRMGDDRTGGDRTANDSSAVAIAASL
jgi:hypothetical protein